MIDLVALWQSVVVVLICMVGAAICITIAFVIFCVLGEVAFTILACALIFALFVLVVYAIV